MPPFLAPILVGVVCVLACLYITCNLALGRHRSGLSIGRRNSTAPVVISEPAEKTASKRNTAATCIDRDKLLFHRLQNLSSLNSQIISKARARLLECLDRVISQAHEAEILSPSILAVRNFTPKALSSYISEHSSLTTAVWTAYLARRRAGRPRELLLTRHHALQWLESAAPVKLVDGAWLSRQHHARTSPELRPVTRIAWQIFAEEMGDGDLPRNHVHLYRQLLQSCGSELPPSDSLDFIDSQVNSNQNADVWAAAAVQLCLGIFPDEFLPEALGFSLAYERVAMDTLMCAHELKELGLDPRYFNLHITIDNADSGHTAMALDAVIKFLQQPEGGPIIGTSQQRWRRVQAGFLLATEIPLNPGLTNSAELEVLQIFSNKLISSKAAHMTCRGVIGGHAGYAKMSLGSWLDPSSWEARKFHFLEVLSNSCWIVRGDARKSRFVKELAWGGRMFGAFTAKEKVAVEDWINGLQSAVPLVEERRDSGHYRKFVGDCTNHGSGTAKSPSWGIAPPLHFSTVLAPSSITPEIGPPSFGKATPTLSMTQEGIANCLQHTLIPLQHALASPVQAATPEGMAILRILRVLNGFSAQPPADAVNGMDEIYHPSRSCLAGIATQLRRSNSDIPTCQSGSQSFARLDPAWYWLWQLSLDPKSNIWFLLGVLQGFISNTIANKALLQASGLEHETISALRVIGAAVVKELNSLCVENRRECQLGFTFVCECLRAYAAA